MSEIQRWPMQKKYVYPLLHTQQLTIGVDFVQIACMVYKNKFVQNSVLMLKKQQVLIEQINSNKNGISL